MVTKAGQAMQAMTKRTARCCSQGPPEENPFRVPTLAELAQAQAAASAQRVGVAYEVRAPGVGLCTWTAFAHLCYPLSQQRGIAQL